jgi:hypothetical protein
LKPQAAKKHTDRRRSSTAPAHTPAASRWNCDWIPSVAEPYLRGYAPQFEKGRDLVGYRFVAQNSARAPRSAKKTRQGASGAPSAGFFIGYLIESRAKSGGLPFLKAMPPEFVVFCFVEPAGGRVHRRLVGETDSLMRRTAEYVRWLTHRLPRFELFPDEHASLIRHVPTQEWPSNRVDHYARNFLIETLAWLVRSALVRRLPGEIAASLHPTSKSRAAAQ